jgi:hypothetical protein
MLRWIMIGTTLLGFGLAIATRSPGLLGLGLVVGFVSLFGLVFSVAGERIASNARPDTAMLPPEAMAAIRARAQAEAARKGQASQGNATTQN